MIAELKVQISEKKKPDAPEAEKIEDKEVKETEPGVEVEIQTDILMDYFDRSNHAQSKQESRTSVGSNKQRVGGGGSIVKPPKSI